MTVALLNQKIAAFLGAREALLASDEADDEAAWDVYEATEHEIIVHPCASIAEVRIKAKFFLDCEPAYDTIRNCVGEHEETLRTFLRSLLGEGGAS